MSQSEWIAGTIAVIAVIGTIVGISAYVRFRLKLAQFMEEEDAREAAEKPDSEANGTPRHQSNKPSSV